MRTFLLGLLLGVLISVIGGAILVATLPSDEDIQKISLEEFGIDPNVTENPFIAGIIEQIITPVQERVRDRVIDDVQTSALLTAAGVITLSGLGAALIAADSRRRAAAPPRTDP